MELPFIDQDKLASWLETETKLNVADDALVAVTHSIRCVVRHHVKVARIAVAGEVKAAVADNRFEDLPSLAARHFAKPLQPA